jgi:hypothetical protein
MSSLVIVGTAIARIGWLPDEDGETYNTKKQGNPNSGNWGRIFPESLILGESTKLV